MLSGGGMDAIELQLLGRILRTEVKARATGFATLYAWLENRDLLIVKADRREPLVILPLRLSAEIAGKQAAPTEAGAELPQG